MTLLVDQYENERKFFIHFYKTFVVLEFVYNSHLSASLWRKKSSAVEFVLIFWQVWRKVKSAFLYRIEIKTKTKYSKQFCIKFFLCTNRNFSFLIQIEFSNTKKILFSEFMHKNEMQIKIFLRKMPKIEGTGSAGGNIEKDNQK